MHMHQRGFVFFAASLYALTMPRVSPAQVLYGSIVGNVKDASDASVAQATVVITNTDTRQSRQETTNEMGGYSFPTLPPGVYDLRVGKEGFTTFTQAGIPVTINNVTRLDVTLKVGAITESVTVIGLAAALQTDRAEVRTEMSSGQVSALPTSLGRNYQQLLVMVPGFSPPRNENSVPSNPSRALGFNVNGMSYSINSTRIDGAQSINVWLPHEAAYVPTLESVETVTTATNSFDAETGLAGGAAIYVQTKTGTNDLHGAIFENHSNQHLKAKPFFIPPGAVKPKLVYNEFGGAVGGPIKKERLFYFVSFERNNDRETANQYVTVPTAAIKSGNMSGSSNPIYDPLTGDAAGAGRTPFPDKIVPSARISRITRYLSDQTPLPNGGADALTQNYFATASYIFDRNRLDAKVNWNAGKLTTFGRLGFLRYNMSNPPVFGEMGGTQTSDAGGNPGHGWGDTYTVVAAGNYMLTNRFIVDAYFGWTSLGTNVDTPGVEEQQGLKLGIPGTNGPARYQGGWPKFSVSNYSDLGTPGAYLPYYRTDPSKNYVVNFNWVKGAHDIRFGLDTSFQAMNHIQAEGGSGIGAGMGGFTFTGGPTTVRGGPSSNQYNSYAAFLLGLPYSVGKNVITSKDDKVTTRAWQYSSYVRDRWNVTPSMTLSVGVRWEYYPVPVRADSGLGFYDFGNNTVRVCGYGSVPGGCGVDVGKFRLLPRVGLAYRASRTFVIRAGYGITNDPWSLARGFRTNFPAMLSLDYSGENSYQPFGRIESGIPAVVMPNLANGVVAVPGTYATNSLPQTFKRGYIQSWNLTLQKELRYGFTAQAGYVATRSVATMSPLDLNAGQVPGRGNAGRPLFAPFGRTTLSQMITPVGTNMYDSLQSRLERRFAQGLQIGTSYTWSKVIGWAQDSGAPSIQALPYFGLNRRVLGFDRTHNLQLSGMWELPFGQRKRFLSGSRAVSAVVGGWRVNTLASFMSGTPFTVSASGASLDMPGSSQQADQVKPEVKILGGAGRGASFFDPFAFAPVTQARFGTAGLNRLRGPGIVNWNFGLGRIFALSERVNVQFKMEAFNFSNTPHFSNPGANVSSMVLNPDGSIRSLGGYTEVTSVTNTGRDGIDERMFRIGLRVSF